MFRRTVLAAMEYRRINNQYDADDFLKKVGYFHDGLVKEAHLVERAYVAANLRMNCSFRVDLTVLMQRQSQNRRAVEILFGDVSALTLGRSDIIGEATLEVTEDARKGRLLTFTFNHGTIRAGTMEYRFVDEWIGKELRYRNDPSTGVTREPAQGG